MKLLDWILPSYQKTIKRKLSFLKNEDLSELEPVILNSEKILILWDKINNAMYTKEKRNFLYNKVSNNSLLIKNALEIIKKIKTDIDNKKDIGYIFYHEELNRLYYEEPILP